MLSKLQSGVREFDAFKQGTFLNVESFKSAYLSWRSKRKHLYLPIKTEADLQKLLTKCHRSNKVHIGKVPKKAANINESEIVILTCLDKDGKLFKLITTIGSLILASEAHTFQIDGTFKVAHDQTVILTAITPITNLLWRDVGSARLKTLQIMV